MRNRSGWLPVAMVVAALGCSQQDETAGNGDSAGDATPAAQSAEPAAPAAPDPVRGRTVYMNVCIACHSGNPNDDGVLGPSVADASLELLYARVIRNVYPPDYTPKRDSRTMPPYAYLEERIPDIHAWLEEQYSGSVQ